MWAQTAPRLGTGLCKLRGIWGAMALYDLGCGSGGPKNQSYTVSGLFSNGILAI